jgi:hypothetical protein
MQYHFKDLPGGLIKSFKELKINDELILFKEDFIDSTVLSNLILHREIKEHAELIGAELTIYNGHQIDPRKEFIVIAFMPKINNTKDI